jgi:predicted RNase H-like nuclease (RuvC/YqgF family)
VARNITELNNLQADEQKAMKLSEQLIGLGEENKHLYNTLRLLQTEQVELEAKLTLANDTKRAIDYERGSHGEIAAMKSEIHRMEVRECAARS